MEQNDISVRLDKQTDALLWELSGALKKSRQKVIRDAIKAYHADKVHAQ